jgi:hypothetical protein
MELSIRRWKPGQLLLGWVTYWAGLIGVTMSPAIAAAWRATRLPEGHGTITAGFDDSRINFTVIEDGVKTFVGSTSMTTAILWLAGPPLVLWLIWLLVRERPRSTPASLEKGEGREIGALSPGSDGAAEWRRRDRVPVEPGRVRTPNP